MVGRAILKIRHRKNLTQAVVGERAGLATTYLSRVENERLEPTLATLARIAEALETSVGAIFAEVEKLTDPPCHVCPVSSTGECVGSLMTSGHGKTPEGEKVVYAPGDVKLLRLTEYIIRHGSLKTRAAVECVLESIAQAAGRSFEADDRTNPADKT